MATLPFSRYLITAMFLSTFALMEVVAAAFLEPSWSRQIIPTGQERTIVKSTPIDLRPSRPLHVYGNTVLCRYYRSGPLPATPGSIRSLSGYVFSR